MVQGWATRPVTLTGWPWRRPEGMPATLTARISAAPSVMAISCTRYSGSPFSSALGRLVSKSTTGSASTAHRNAIADGDQQPVLSAAVALADALGISMDQLAGKVTYDLDLSGDWWCAWQTWKDGAPA